MSKTDIKLQEKAKSAEKPSDTASKPTKKSGDLIVMVRVRGGIGIKSDVKDTLNMLHLERKNTCVIAKKSDDIVGMAKKCKDFITYGDASQDLVDKISNERKSVLKKESKTFIGVFPLNPPKKGFGRKGVKVTFTQGGALGYRKDKISDLVLRMI